MKFPNAKYIDEECSIVIGMYGNGRKAIKIVSDVDGQPMMTATSNLPEFDIDLEDDDVIIKTYSENEGILQDLIDNGIISKPHMELMNGFALFPVAKLTEEYRNA